MSTSGHAECANPTGMTEEERNKLNAMFEAAWQTDKETMSLLINPQKDDGAFPRERCPHGTHPWLCVGCNPSFDITVGEHPREKDRREDAALHAAAMEAIQRLFNGYVSTEDARQSLMALRDEIEKMLDALKES